MKKKSIFEKGKTSLKAGALATLVGVAGCSPTPDDESGKVKKDWKMDSSIESPLTGVSCDEIKEVEATMSLEELKDASCNLLDSIVYLTGYEPDEKEWLVNRCKNLEMSLIDHRNDYLAMKGDIECINKIKKGGSFFSPTSNCKINDIKQCNAVYYGYIDIPKNEKFSQRDICEKNFGL